MVAIITLFRSTSTWTFPPAPAPVTSSGIPVHSRKQVLAKGKWHIFSLGSFGPGTKSKGNLYLRVDESGTQRQRLILRERTSGNASGHAQEMLAPPSVPQMPRLLKKTNVVDNYSQGSALGFRHTGMCVCVGGRNKTLEGLICKEKDEKKKTTRHCFHDDLKTATTHV